MPGVFKKCPGLDSQSIACVHKIFSVRHFVARKFDAFDST